MKNHKCIILESDLLKNTVTNVVYRVLYVDNSRRCCYCIETRIKKMKIKIMRLEDIERGFEDGIYTVLTKDDSFELFDENSLGSHRRELLEKRYDIVRVVCNEETIPYCFERNYRGNLIKKAMSEFNVAEKTVYEHLRKYFQGGCTIDALADDYDNCGKCEYKNYKKKPGKRPLAAKGMKDYKGVIIDENVENMFKEGIKRYYRNNPSMSLGFNRSITRELLVEDAAGY